MSGQRTFELLLPTRRGAEFLVFDSNRLASEFLASWPGSGHQGLERCVILCGDSGSGKSHLALQWAKKNQAVDLSLEQVGVEAAGLNNSRRAFVLDSFPTAPLSSQVEDWFFHFLNQLTASQGSLLVTSRVNPKNWEIKLPDLRSRLLAMSLYRLEAAEDDLLRALAVMFFREFQIVVEPELIDYLLARTVRSPAALYQLINQLNEEGLKKHRAVTIQLAREFLTPRPERE
ncbi:MAG: hypothetical protein QM523_08575 [Candidatus Pacebacteria bacterium]|nr:hypothetical protein [Candidatus Paceibacterota bacterium]